MKLSHSIFTLTALNLFAGLFVVGGCAASAEATDDRPDVKPEPAEALVELSVSAAFSAPDADSCKPLNLPLTAFLTHAFAAQTLVEDTATWREDGSCLHEQLLAAPVDALGTLAHNVLCQGGDDPRLCDAVAKRSCSADLLTKWAAVRSEPVASQSPTFGFTFEVPPQSAEARVALSRRAQAEVRILLDETEFVMHALDDGSRNCPDEDRASLEVTYREHARMNQDLEHILSSESAD